MIRNDEITIYKHSSGSYVKGIWVKGAMSSIVRVLCSIQPIAGRDMINFPEGERNQVQFKVYFDVPQMLSLDDLIKYNDRFYKIYSDQSWDKSDILTHTNIYISRIND
jgi:hypothetical protein